jgi:hypothetical protein
MSLDLDYALVICIPYLKLLLINQFVIVQLLKSVLGLIVNLTPSFPITDCTSYYPGPGINEEFFSFFNDNLLLLLFLTVANPWLNPAFDD